MKRITLLLALALTSVSQAAFVYHDNVKAHRASAIIPYIETQILQSCPKAKDLELIGTEITEEEQYGGGGVIYTVHYELSNQLAPMKSAFVVHSMWEDEFGGITVPFEVVYDQMHICK